MATQNQQNPPVKLPANVHAELVTVYDPAFPTDAQGRTSAFITARKCDMWPILR